MVAADTISKRKLSRSVIACLGLMVRTVATSKIFPLWLALPHVCVPCTASQVNRPLRKLSKQLLSVVEAHDSVKFEELEFSPSTSTSAQTLAYRQGAPLHSPLRTAKSASFPDKFVQYALAHGIDAAIDNFWG